MRVSVQPHGYTEDWALILVDREQIDWGTFMGNKVFIGGNLSPSDFEALLFPHSSDKANYRYPDQGLLQAYGVVQRDEIRVPPHFDANHQECLLVVKNGAATGTTVGRANGLESVMRDCPEYGIFGQTSIEIGVFPIGRGRGAFSEPGDSGSIVLTRDGKILGLLTGGAGPTAETDMTFVTPYWWLEQQIKKVFPRAFLYEVVPLP